MEYRRHFLTLCSGGRLTAKTLQSKFACFLLRIIQSYTSTVKTGHAGTARHEELHCCRCVENEEKAPKEEKECKQRTTTTLRQSQSRPQYLLTWRVTVGAFRALRDERRKDGSPGILTWKRTEVGNVRAEAEYMLYLLALQKVYMINVLTHFSSQNLTAKISLFPVPAHRCKKNCEGERAP